MPKPRRQVIILTRRREDNAALADRLRAAGVEVIELPCLRVQQLEDTTALAAAIRSTDPVDWLVVTSRAGAEAVARAARPTCRVAAVGGVTAGRLAQLGIECEFVASIPGGAALARELPPARVALLARSDRALPDLPEILRSRGFDVREIVAYRTIARADGDIEAVRSALIDAARDVSVAVASPSAVEAFVTAAGEFASRATFLVSGTTTESFVRIRVPQARMRRDWEAAFDGSDR